VTEWPQSSASLTDTAHNWLLLAVLALLASEFAVEVDLRFAMVREQNEWSLFLRHTNLFGVPANGMWHSNLGAVRVCAADCVV
jgi:hypothetical protein